VTAVAERQLRSLLEHFVSSRALWETVPAGVIAPPAWRAAEPEKGAERAGLQTEWLSRLPVC